MKKIINIEHQISLLLNLVSSCPLKYFVVNFKNDCFIITPLFPYIVYYISEYIKIDDCEYFNKEKYNNISFLSNRIKGEYFEFSAKFGIKEQLKLPFKEYEEVFVDQIAEMNEIVKPLEEFISSLKKSDIGKEEENKEEEFIVEQNDDNNNSSITINLNEEIDYNKIEQLIEQNFMNEYKNIDFGKEAKQTKLKEKKEDLFNIINLEELNELKNIDDYRKKEIKKRIKAKANKIFKNLENKKKNNKKKRIITFSIKEKKVIKYISSKEYTGNENFFIDQKNPNGKMVDYAILYGDKNEKHLVAFQMKCYSSNTTLEDIFINKTKIRDKLSPALINSSKLFNCQIKFWDYFLIFYYNEKDIINNNIGLRAIIPLISENIDYLLYNPKEKKFYSEFDGKLIKINQLKFSQKSNLDYSNYS